MASLGSLTSDALNGFRTYPYRLLFPAALISIIILAFNLFGDGPGCAGSEDEEVRKCKARAAEHLRLICVFAGLFYL